MLALTPIAVTVLAEPLNCPLAGVTVSQFAAEMAFQLVRPAQLALLVRLKDRLLGLLWPETAVKGIMPELNVNPQWAWTVRETLILCGLLYTPWGPLNTSIS